MTELEKAARQALDALENEWFWPTPQFAIDAIDALRAALRAALAQQQAEPAEQAEPEHWVITAKVGEIVGFRAPGLKKGDRVYPHPQQQAEPVALNYARRLAQSIWTKHYNIVEEWKPLDDLIGVLTQIDNMTSGLTRQQAEPVVEKMNINQGETK